jgi:hypothetical protein
MEQLAQPGGLSHAVGDGAVLSFRAGPRDGRLSLGRPGYKVVPEEHRIAGRRVTSVRTSSPVSVSVNDEVGVGRVAQKETVIRRPRGSAVCTSWSSDEAPEGHTCADKYVVRRRRYRAE